MPYLKHTYRAGKTKEVIYCYSPRADIKEGSRRKKENKTKEAQKLVNIRRVIKKLTRILNANFDDTSLYITFSYIKDKRPLTKEELRKDIDKLLRKFRTLYKKQSKVLKYVWVAEVGERGAVHIHAVVNEIETSQLKNVWSKGWISIKPLDSSGQYRKLASYFVKYSTKTKKTEKEITGRYYNSSKNLIIPEPKKEVVSGRNAYNHKITVPSGWYLDKESVVEAWHEVTGYMYFTYTLIFDGRKPKKEEIGVHTYTLNLETGEVEITEHVKGVNKNKTHKRKAGQG